MKRPFLDDAAFDVVDALVNDEGVFVQGIYFILQGADFEAGHGRVDNVVVVAALAAFAVATLAFIDRYTATDLFDDHFLNGFALF